MKKIYIPFLGLALMASLFLLNSCRRDVQPVAPLTDQISFTQPFDSIEGALNQGWVLKNNSRPLGPLTWFQGVYAGFPGGFNSYTGADYIAANYQSAAAPPVGGESTISNWLISPARPMKNGDVITFYSRSFNNPATYPDRLELRLNTISNGSTEVGNDSSSVGDFTKLLLSINPTVNTTSYPATWTQYSYTISGLAAPKTSARFAFRYYKPLRRNSSGGYGGYIGIDEVTFSSVK